MVGIFENFDFETFRKYYRSRPEKSRKLFYAFFDWYFGLKCLLFTKERINSIYTLFNQINIKILIQKH
jgi:hypothetical protein